MQRLLRSRADGGGGFTAALTSSGKYFASAERFHEFIVRMGGNGYWNQVDVWFTRDADVMRASRRPICLQQQSTERARKSCYAFTGRRVDKPHAASKAP